jgi:pyruvate/2-oxoglutarate dehydrogenase complex dihydrolipoamide acyltransferase (E2) component
MSDQGFRVVPFTRERQIVIDSLTIGARRHIVHGLIEVDVTDARRFIRKHKAQTGETLSFTAFIIVCLARAIDANKYLHAYRDWRNRLILFDEVDVVTIIESEVNQVAIPHIIRAANQKTFREIHDEIRSIQTRPTQSEQKSGWLMRLAPYVPGFVRRFFFWALLKNPHWLKKNSGTVVVSAVGMFGRGSWGIVIVPIHTLGITIGGIVEKPGVVDGRIEIREYFDLTISVDHDIVDGAPTARFTQQLRELIKGGYGLEA